MTDDLRGMMDRAAMRIRQSHLDALAELGVSYGALARLGQRQPSIGVIEGAAGLDGLFHVGGPRTYAVQPIITCGHIVDLVAWRTTRPDRWHLFNGLGWCMGEDSLSLPPGDPVKLHSTPLAWLASGGEGICILDWAAPELRTLRGHAEFIVSEPALGDLLKRKLAQTMPRIIVDKGVTHGKAA